MRLAKTPAILSLVLVTLVGEAAAQGTDVVCRTEFAWMKNSRGQSPCLVAAYLNSACLADPTKSYVESLAAEFHYNPPTRVAATKCQCSTVYYTAISACAACQGNIEDVLPWSTWTLNCTSTGTGTFPGVWPTVVPEGSAIPAWGYMDVVKPDVFNLTLAQQLAAEHQPDTTGVSSTIPAATSTSTSTTAAPSQAMTTAAAESSGSSGSKAKQIVIGTVLGAVILALICVIIVLLVRRARSRSPVRAVVSPTGEKAGLSAGMRLPLYDPSNPATFPAEPFDSSYRSDH